MVNQDILTLLSMVAEGLQSRGGIYILLQIKIKVKMLFLIYLS